MSLISRLQLQFTLKNVNYYINYYDPKALAQWSTKRMGRWRKHYSL